ncbi:hypothetical protein BP5796_07582 [Coleophoma crateriformis]|uniref:BZIP domain-containing protein n=1 Tax=Coleophoma crateriformis TaxID=565419 RepID=A0A3D8RJI9_9HELO|nr:hypothetical protein BP5796_07582 [Coleophoma crateriformis]
MSDQLESRSTRSPSPTRPKRARKLSRGKNGSEDKQRERKRALDRKAQRASREKTRSHIAHLEKMVAILTEKNGNGTTAELLEEMGRLHDEIDRLRKIIEGIKSALGGEHLGEGKLGVRQELPESKKIVDLQTETQEPIETEEYDSVPTPPATEPEPSWCSTTTDDMDGIEPQDIDETPSSTMTDTALVKVKGSHSPEVSVLSWNNSWETCHDPGTPEMEIKVPGPLQTAMPASTPMSYKPCALWQRANNIYAQMFAFSRERAALANHADEGSLVKVVKYGWGSLSLKERSNPLLIILKEVDQQLFWDLDPVTKIANLYKSWLLLKYYFTSEAHNLEKMPDWQRPVRSQQINQHPIPIDFFPWPALRDRLVRQHSYYFSTAEFSVYYRQHFKFCWPFRFEDTYCYDSATNSYSISPLFIRYHRDMRCWSMQKRFFEKFPEFVGDITAYERGFVGVDSTVPVLLKRFGKLEGYAHEACGKDIPCGFTDAEVLDLFNQYPTIL